MTDERTAAYLLQELTEREAEQFEEELFAQQEWPDADLDSAEEDLVQAYIRKELSPERQRRFEENYLTTEARKERELLARSFLRVVCSPDPAKVTWWQRFEAFLKSLVFAPRFAVPRFAAIVVTVGLAVALLWVAFRTRPPQTFAQLNLAISTENRAASGQTQKIRLPLAKDALRVSLTLPEVTSSGAAYRVEWEDVKGPLETFEVKTEDGKSVSVVIPAERLKPGQYTLKLYRRNSDGTEQRVTGNYLFDVE